MKALERPRRTTGCLSISNCDTTLRGADVGHIRRFQKDYRAAPAPLKLETNYRSTPTILRAANVIAAKDPEALPKTLRPADPKAPLGLSISIR